MRIMAEIEGFKWHEFHQKMEDFCMKVEVMICNVNENGGGGGGGEREWAVERLEGRG